MGTNSDTGVNARVNSDFINPDHCTVPTHANIHRSVPADFRRPCLINRETSKMICGDFPRPTNSIRRLQKVSRINCLLSSQILGNIFKSENIYFIQLALKISFNFHSHFIVILFAGRIEPHSYLYILHEMSVRMTMTDIHDGYGLGIFSPTTEYKAIGRIRL